MNIKINGYRGDWIIGEMGNYTFCAKHFDEPSEFGINNGRTSKLSIQDKNTKKYIVNYDRGWDIKPKTKENKTILKNLVDYLENLPKRF